MNRKILHLDLDAFFCAVEEGKDPDLAGKPFAVGGRPDQRGVVASCSYPARKFGVRSAMPMSRAVRLCPDLIIVSQSRGDYSRASREVMKRLRELTPLVEQLSIDEAFLDVTALPDSAERIARGLQARIREELNLPNSIGVASNKLVAKIANNIGKAGFQGDGPPNAITVVPPGEEETFLAPLPVRELWGVGPKTAERLAEMDIHTIGDLTQWSELDLSKRFGKHGYDLARRARGIDNREIVTEYETKSVSAERTFATDITSSEELKKKIGDISADVARRLKRSRLKGRTVQIKLRWEDFTTLTRQTTLPHPTDDSAEITRLALALFDQTWEPGRPVRLVGVGVANIEEVTQLGLWDEPPDTAHQQLRETLDDLEKRFGKDIIKRADEL